MSYYYKTRKLRGIKQRMFLLGVSYNIETVIDSNDSTALTDSTNLTDSNWVFQVKGTTSDYTVGISAQSVCCSCPDYKTRGGICKHIYFIIGRIAECSGIIDLLEREIQNNERESCLTKDEYVTVSNALISKLSSRLNSVETTDSKEDKCDLPDLSDEICVICFEELSNDKVVQCITEGQHCKNYYHKVCLDAWLYKSSSCPLCRRLWVINGNNKSHDPLDQLDIQNIKL